MQYFNVWIRGRGTNDVNKSTCSPAGNPPRDHDVIFATTAYSQALHKLKIRLPFFAVNAITHAVGRNTQINTICLV